MSNYNRCPITNESWKHNLPDEPPILRHDISLNEYEIVCPCCLLNTGLYKTVEQAEERWVVLSKNEIALQEYIALSWNEKFPDHVEGSSIIRKE